MIAGMTRRERAALALQVLREARGEPMLSREIAEKMGLPSAKSLTGDTYATLFILEWEGLIGRMGRRRGCKWYALMDVADVPLLAVA